MSQQLRKIMVEKVVTTRPSGTAKQAAELMNLHEIGCLVIVDHEKPVGILTERDMLKRVVCKSRQPRTTRIVDLMSKPLITASPDMLAGDATKLMLERNIKKLVVVENGRLVGLVTLTDLLRSRGVVEFLNRHSFEGASERMKRVMGLYYDSNQLHRRTCPLNAKDGFSMSCQSVKCMWWTGKECAVTKLTQQIPQEGLQEANEKQESVIED